MQKGNQKTLRNNKKELCFVFMGSSSWTITSRKRRHHRCLQFYKKKKQKCIDLPELTSKQEIFYFIFLFIFLFLTHYIHIGDRKSHMHKRNAWCMYYTLHYCRLFIHFDILFNHFFVFSFSFVFSSKICFESRRFILSGWLLLLLLPLFIWMCAFFSVIFVKKINNFSSHRLYHFIS